MPWLEATPMEQRERFIRDQQNGLYTMTELCDRPQEQSVTHAAG